MTGCKAPAKRTSFLIFGEEWTRFPITPIYKKRKLSCVSSGTLQATTD